MTRRERLSLDVYRVVFPDGEVLRFHYHVVQLNRLNWRRFVHAANPIASALMAKMKIAERDRARVKVECLRLMLTLKLDRARMRLIASFVDAYLNLNQEEEKVFRRTLEKADLKPEEKEVVVEYVTSWERRGIEKGRMEGLEEGRMEGRMEGLAVLREVLLDVLTTRFGDPGVSVAMKVRQLDSIEELRRLTHAALTAGAPEELGL